MAGRWRLNGGPVWPPAEPTWVGRHTGTSIPSNSTSGGPLRNVAAGRDATRSPATRFQPNAASPRRANDAADNHGRRSWEGEPPELVVGPISRSIWYTGTAPTRHGRTEISRALD
ncbi:MAG TPA: hypothetical protein VF221_09475, partial [Chloroflexota bacterium]